MDIDKNSLKDLVSIIVVVVVLGFLFYSYEGKPSDDNNINYSYSYNLTSLSEDSLSKIPKGFPRQFILGDSPEVIEGEFKRISLNKIKASVSFKDLLIDDTLETYVDRYIDFAINTRWSININQFIAEDNEHILQLRRGSQEVLISFSEKKSMGELLVKVEYYANNSDL